ncbi:hypothetical protein AURDEDRAFT_160081 [Auricularia subglabra TFB-10046 SS5]|nr:hypothetical protein AURDEDRAFT_160081 [Auricularia subglabra TFB-10046 SS5]
MSWPEPFPSWLPETLGCALGAGNVKLTFEGRDIPAFAPSDDQEEDEAQFTDESEAESDTTSESSSSEAADAEKDITHSLIGAMRVSGADWTTDSEDGDYMPPEDSDGTSVQA